MGKAVRGLRNPVQRSGNGQHSSEAQGNGNGNQLLRPRKDDAVLILICRGEAMTSTVPQCRGNTEQRSGDEMNSLALQWQCEVEQ